MAKNVSTVHELNVKLVWKDPGTEVIPVVSWDDVPTHAGWSGKIYQGTDKDKAWNAKIEKTSSFRDSNGRPVVLKAFLSQSTSKERKDEIDVSMFSSTGMTGFNVDEFIEFMRAIEEAKEKLKQKLVSVQLQAVADGLKVVDFFVIPPHEMKKGA